MPIEKVHQLAPPSPEEAREFVRRAMVAAMSEKDAAGRPMPDPERCAVRLLDGLGYVLVRDAAGAVLAVYRIRPDNLALRRMKRWPARIEN